MFVPGSRIVGIMVNSRDKIGQMVIGLALISRTLWTVFILGDISKLLSSKVQKLDLPMLPTAILKKRDKV